MRLPDRSTPPAIHPPEEITLSTPIRRTLSNGIPLLYIPNEQLDIIHLLVRIHAGTLYEPCKHLSLFTYSLLKESSSAYTANELADLLDFNGAYYTTSQTLEYITLTLTIPKARMETVLPVIADCLLHPHYREENLTLYRERRIKDLEYNERKTDFRATQQLLHAMFGDNYTAGQLSSRENLSAITVPQMTNYHRNTFVAENVTVFVTGNVDDHLYTFIGQLFENIPSGQPSKPLEHIPMPASPDRDIRMHLPEAVQASLNIGMPNIGYNHPDKRDFSILSTIVGGYFGSRLMQRLREKEGYTYGISSGSVYFGDQSLFIINGNVNAHDADAALQACFEELQRMQNAPIPPEELELARNFILGDMIRDVENSVSYIKKLAFWHQYGLDEQEFQTMISHVKKITPERLQNLAIKYLSYNNFIKIVVQ